MNDKKGLQQTVLDFNQMSELGLIFLINKQVLHPLGLSLTRELETGKSCGAIIASDLVWKYKPSTEKKERNKLEKFLRKRENILRKALSESTLLENTGD